jgi:N-methylhydantoinase A
MSLSDASANPRPASTRRAYFADGGWADAPVHGFEAMRAGDAVTGPAIIESAFTTVVIDPGASAAKRPSGSLSIAVGP